MNSIKEREQYAYCQQSNQDYNNSYRKADALDKRDYFADNNIAYTRNSNSNNDYRYNSASNMRNYSNNTHNYGGNNSGAGRKDEYSSLNRYYGVPQVKNDIENDNRVVAQNQNTTTYLRNSRVTENSDYSNYNCANYNDAPKVAKKKLSNKVKVCIIVVCLAIVLAISLTIANLLPNASAQTPAQDKQQVTVEENVGKVVDDQGNISDVKLVDSGSSYNYDTKTNWFDRFCDWIENRVG